MNDRHFRSALIALLVFVAGCGPGDYYGARSRTASIPQSGRIQSADDAIAVVRRATKRRGGDPNASEYHVSHRGDQWVVMSWHIHYPENTGPSRFVPGGYTSYTISSDGKILETMPGL